MGERPSLKDLVQRFQVAENWTPENDGETHDLSDEIKVRLMADYSLTKAEVDALGRAAA